MAAVREVIDLIERFERNHDTYRSHEYNETETRREFIDPFFKALDWDIDNNQGYAEAYKDVVHEDAIKIGGATKAPDYAFRIGGARKFFVEAKRPGVNIKNDPDPAYLLQLHGEYRTKRLRQIEDKRNRKRRELYNEQDRIDEQRDGLIRKIERQLEQRRSVKTLFCIRWEVQ